MLTIDGLREFGADVDEGLKRCVNNEEFYLRMVEKAMDDPTVEELFSSIEGKDLDTAFEKAHALKGVWGNLALKPLYDPVAEMVELLRSGKDVDYSGFVELIREKKSELESL